MGKSLIEYLAEKQALVFFSHRLETLYEHLKENLLASSPFSKKVVVVPSQHMKRWLKLRCAKDPAMGICAGIEFSFLNEGVLSLSQTLFQSEQRKAPLTSLPLSFTLASAIKSTLGRYEMMEDEEQKLWEPLYSYLTSEGREINDAYLFPLCIDLTTLFGRYGIYGGGELKKWIEKPNHWQEALWKVIFGEKKNTFISLLENLELPEKRLEGITYHFFSFSHLPPLFFRFFCKAASYLPLFFYQLSPCLSFWSDISTWREGRNIARVLKRKGVKPSTISLLETAFDEANPLLRSWGKVGRECAKLFEESELEVVEDYPALPQERYTLLEALQRDMLEFRQPEKEGPLPIDEGGESVEIHAFASPRSEIEGLYTRLCTLLNGSSLYPHDIIVMAPDITLYLPYIKAYFGGTIPYKVSDLSIQTENRLAKGLFLLFSLKKRRWSTTALFELFTHPPFQKKYSLQSDDIALLREWVHQAGILWGIDAEDRSDHLSKPTQESKGTWEEGIDTLLFAFASNEGFEFSKVPLLETLSSIFVSLREDLKIFYDGSKASLKEWSTYLATLIDTYFYSQEEERKEREEIDRKLETVVHLENALGKQEYTFSDFFPLLEHYFAEEKVEIGREYAATLSFCSMLPMRAIPAKVICILGLNLEAFPRKERLRPLDLLLQKKGDYCPSRIDFDRYLFLETLLSAREKIIFSYIDRSMDDSTPLPPSILLSEIQNYVKRFYGFNKKTASSPLPSQPKTKRKPVIPSSLSQIQEKGEIPIEFSNLQKALASPLRHYLKNKLGLQLKRTPVLKEEEEFILSPLLLSRFKGELLKTSFDQAVAKTTKDPDFPPGVYGKSAFSTLENEYKELHHFLEKEGTTLAPTTLEFPSFVLKYKEETTFVLHGKLEGVLPHGLLINEKANLKGALKALPSFLMLSLLRGPSEKLFFARELKVKAPFSHSPEKLLLRLIEYYFHISHHPSCLFPGWVESLLKKDSAALEENIAHLLVSSDELSPFLSRFSPEELIEKEAPLAELLFKEVYEAWF